MKSKFSLLFSIDINSCNDKTETKLTPSDKLERRSKKKLVPKIMKFEGLFVWFGENQVFRYWNALQEEIPSIS